MSPQSNVQIVIPADQVQKRVREMARQISHDYVGKTIHALGILENGFIFLSDLVRAIEVPVVCQFIKPKYRDDIGDVTAEFLINDLKARGAATVKIAALLDRQSARRVQLQPDYFGFLVDGTYLMGYGLGSREQTDRNLPHLAIAK